MADTLERAVNGLSDVDSLWWPLLSWRPKPTVLFSENLILRILAVGIPLGAAALALILWKIVHLKDWNYFGLMALLSIPLCYLYLKFVMAWAWNRRALRQKDDRSPQ
jgi:hypothetical protein